MRERFRWVLALSSGLMLGLAFPPFPFPWLAWVAYVPLIAAVRHCEWRTSAALASSAHLVAYAIAGHWVLLHADPFTRAASAAGMVWLAVIAASPWIAATINHQKGGAPGLLTLVAAFGLLDWLQLHTEIGFPWSALGNTQSEFEPFNQLAEFAGVTGLSLWVLSINLGLYSLLEMQSRKRQALAVAVSTFIVGSAWLGASRIENVIAEPASPAKEIRILAIQPSLPLAHWADASSGSRIDSLADLTDRALIEMGGNERAYDLIVWPETAIPPTNLGLPSSLAELRSRVDKWGVTLLSGAIETTPGSEPVSPFRNAAFLLDPRTSTVQSYRKQRLVPFAEYVPYSANLPMLQRLAVPSGGVWGYTPGTADGLFEVSDSIRIGVLICFESSFGFLAKRLSDKGADLLIVLTQDGWWGKSSGYRQHLAFNRLRAIETRLPLAQVSATGLTALIWPNGRVAAEMEWMERGSVSWSVSRRQDGASGTLYTRYGDWPSGLCAMLAVFLILGAIRKRSSARKKQ